MTTKSNNTDADTDTTIHDVELPVSEKNRIIQFALGLFGLIFFAGASISYYFGTLETTQLYTC